MAKPFLKWAGGKRQILPAIRQRLPDNLDQFTTYIEPFVGGGAVLFDLLEKYEFENVHIADINPELILCYQTLQTSAEEVFTHLQELIEQYPGEDEARSKFYYEVRNTWNKNVDRIEQLSEDEKACRVAQTIFLNKTCFNGLFRVNSNGRFNVPVGRYKKPSFPTKKFLQEIQVALEGVKIHLASYYECDTWVDESTFVYFDPPYLPLSETSSFTSYSKNGFGLDQQIELVNLFKVLNDKHVKLMLSNSDPPSGFIDEHYGEFEVKRVPASRSINSKGEGRGKVNEVIVTNY